MKIQDVICIYDPGCHCAFTDIIRWHGRIYVTCREAVNHSVHLSGQVVVLGSANHGRTFQVHARLAMDGYDLRDPHFFVAGNRLGLAMPSWIVPDPAQGIPERVRTCHLAQSDDGIHWDLRRSTSLDAKAAWRPQTGPDGLLYTAGYEVSSIPAQDRVALYRSADGWDWEFVSAIYREDRANETDLAFTPAGELFALVRREVDPHTPILARSKPPYTEWTHVACDRFLKGPLLVCLPDGSLLAVGRSREPMDPHPAAGSGGYQTRGFRVDPATGAMEYLFTLPSGGDTSYAGYCQLDEATALISYYSGHGHANGHYCGGEQCQHCAIYVARVSLG